MDYLEFIARVTSHIPDKGQVMVRYYGLYANAHWGKARKTAVSPVTLSEEDRQPVPSKGWAAMIRKVYEVDPMICPKCGGTMKVVAFITDYAAVDRIIDHLKLTFMAEKPTSIRGKDYLLYARGSVDADLFRKECREERKSKFLSPVKHLLPKLCKSTYLSYAIAVWISIKA